MENKSITDLTELLIKQVEIIDRKNELLKHASDKFRDLDKLAVMCKGIRFNSAESASEFMDVIGNTLRKLSYERFDLLEESEIGQPEAIEVSASDTTKTPEQELTELEKEVEDDLPFC